MTDLSLRERLDVVLANSAHLGSAEQADDAIKCLLTYLSDNGLVIVPVKATHPMLFEGDNKSATRTIWAAMVKAAPPAADLLRGKTNDKG